MPRTGFCGFETSATAGMQTLRVLRRLKVDIEHGDASQMQSFPRTSMNLFGRWVMEYEARDLTAALKS